MSEIPTTRRPRRSRAFAAVIAVLALGGAACASAADDSAASGGSSEEAVQSAGKVEATPQFLMNAAERAQATSHRFEILLSMTGDVSQSAPLATGEFDGTTSHLMMDMEVMFDEVAAAIGEVVPGLAGDMTFEMVGNDEAMFLRAPFFATVARMAPSGEDLGPLGDLADLGDDWGRIDIDGLEDYVAADMQEAITNEMGVDPQAVIDMIKNTESVEELGTNELRGAQVTGMSAQVALADVIEASGTDTDAFAGFNDDDEADRALREMTVPVSVWVDDDGLLHRLEYGYSMTEIAETLGEGSTGPDPFGMDQIKMQVALDMFDHGDDITIDLPSDAIDITEAFAALAQE